MLACLMNKPRARDEPHIGQTSLDRLQRHARLWAGILGGTVGIQDIQRLRIVEEQIHDYGLAWLRARGNQGMRSDTISVARLIPDKEPRAKSVPRRPLTGPRRDRDASFKRFPATALGSGKLSRTSSKENAARLFRTIETATETVQRFCSMTGISPEHLDGHGSHLAGIAFYFSVFVALTAGIDSTREGEARLLKRLRECREEIHRWV